MEDIITDLQKDNALDFADKVLRRVANEGAPIAALKIKEIGVSVSTKPFTITITIKF